MAGSGWDRPRCERQRCPWLEPSWPSWPSTLPLRHLLWGSGPSGLPSASPRTLPQSRPSLPGGNPVRNLAQGEMDRCPGGLPLPTYTHLSPAPQSNQDHRGLPVTHTHTHTHTGPGPLLCKHPHRILKKAPPHLVIFKVGWGEIMDSVCVCVCVGECPPPL